MTASLVRQWLVQLVLALACLGAVTPAARADALDDFVSLYKDIENEVGSSNMPVSAYYLEDSKNYMRCLAGGTDVLVCTDQFHDTGAGKDAANQAGIPSGFWMALDSYVAYKQGDYWSAAWSLGQAAACVALQILAAGTDLCGLVQELYEVAKSIYEGAAAVLDFLGDIGGAVWGGISDAAESFCKGIGFCDDDDGAPLYVALLNVVYSPRVQEGVGARESSNPKAYAPVLLDSLAAAAMAWAKSFYSAGMALFSEADKQEFLAQMEPYFKSSIATAEQGYTAAVDAAWTGDITGRVVPQLAQKRAQYVAQQIPGLAQQAAVKYGQDKSDPYWTVRNRCTADFKGDGFAMVDKWIQYFPLKASELNLKGNSDWCGETLWGANKYKFADAFRDYVKAHVCASSGEAIVCDDLDRFRVCTGLLRAVDQQQQCKINAVKLGKQAAEKIQAEFNSRGSKIPCLTIVPSFSFSLGNPSLVQLQCSRPTQFKACEEAYQRLFADLPTKVLNCSLKETTEYAALKGKVALAVNALNAELGPGSLLVDSAGDPLLAYAASRAIVSSVEEHSRQNWGFGPPSSKPGFEYRLFVPKSVDGLSTPAVWFEVQLPGVDKPVQDRFGALKEKLNPADIRARRDNLVVHPLDEARVRAPALAEVTAPQQQQQVMSGSLPGLPATPGQLQVTRGVQGVSKVPSTMAAGLPALAPIGSAATVTSSRTAAGVSRATPSVTGGLPALAPVTGMGAVPLITGSGGQTEVRSGPAPQGAQQTQSTTPALTASPPPAIQTAPAALPGLAVPGSPGLATTRRLPDLMYAGMARVGGVSGAWNGSVAVNALQATKTGGLCYLPLDYTVSNGGQLDSGMFRAAVTNAMAPGSGWQHGLRALPPGAGLTDSGTIALRAGRNSLQFVLDDAGLVAETNEANNRATLAVNVSGSCESFSPAPPAPTNDPGRLIGPGLIRR